MAGIFFKFYINHRNFFLIVIVFKADPHIAAIYTMLVFEKFFLLATLLYIETISNYYKAMAAFFMRLKTLNTYLPFILLLLIILFTVIIRVRLINVPLERDEGEYAYMGQLILDGTPPYTEAYNMKFPGIYFIYAGILWIFGQTQIAIHFCLLLVNVLSIILLYILARKAYDDWAAVSAAGAFALLSMSYHVMGYWANAEQFILPFVIGAYLLLLLGT